MFNEIVSYWWVWLILRIIFQIAAAKIHKENHGKSFTKNGIEYTEILSDQTRKFGNLIAYLGFFCLIACVSSVVIWAILNIVTITISTT